MLIRHVKFKSRRYAETLQYIRSHKTHVMTKYYALIFIFLFPFTESVLSQELMYAEGKHKIVFQGVKIRPGKALKLSDLNCDDAKRHFAKAKRMRTLNIILSQIGIGEITYGLFTFNLTEKGVLHSVLGGGILFFVSERDQKIQKQINDGVKAFNLCQFMKE